MDDEMAFPERLKKAMKEARVTQDELAKRLDVSRALVGHWGSGQRAPDEATVARLAAALGVDVHWLREGPARPVASTTVGWGFPPPIPGQRDFGNANVWTVPADMKTEIREAGQNISDAHDGKSKATVMRFRVIELQGTDVKAFKEAARWGELAAHLAAASKTKGKLARKLAAGVARLEGAPDRLLLLRIDDFGTTGLVGPEEGEGPFAALVRNNLDSNKHSTGAGGSFGLGKAAHWRCSDVSTVFFNSVTATHGARVIARAELTYHELGASKHAGPGWFGRPTDAGIVESVDDAALAARLYLTRDPLPEEFSHLVATQYGTSILVVGFQDPASEEPDDPAALLESMEREIAVNFWPAIRRNRVIALVEHQVGNHVRETRVVDPRRFVPDLCGMFDKFLADDTVDSFEHEGDVVSTTVPIRLPRCKLDRADVLKHGQVEAEAKLLISLADPDELAEAASRRLSGADAARAKLRKSLVNTVALVRGPLMVTHYASKEGIMVGARPFFAVLLAGEASGNATDSKYVEQFLRAAEPPAHDRWMFTDDLREMYERGAKARLDEFLGEKLADALRKVLRVPSRDDSDGPPELKKLLSFGGPGPSEGSEAIAVLRNVVPLFLGDRWSIKADVLVKRKEKALRIEPYVAMNVESGRPLRIRWQTLECVPTAGVKPQDGGFLLDGAGRFTFRGTTEPSDVPIDPARCTARVAMVVKEVRS